METQSAIGTSQPPLGTSDFTPSSVSSGAPTGTFVGKKVIELREELKGLQNSIAQHNAQLQELRGRIISDSQRYHRTVASVNSRLQVGTTPGNPILVQQFNSAQNDLDRLSVDIAEMNKLTTSVAGNSTLSGYLSESARAAFGISGAVDEDHTQLAILEDEVNRTVVLVDRLLKEVTEDVRRQTSYVSTERGNLNLLSAGVKSGEIYGASLVNRAMVSTAGSGGGPVMAADTAGKRPLVVIRFDRPNVSYQQAVYNAVSKVLERRPTAIFDLVAVSPSTGGAAKVALNSNKSRRQAEGVLRSLMEMGLPPNRIALSGKTSPGVRGNEVHLYLR
ncbi:MAG: hypothetical protein OEY85_06370 [Rhodospirillales bacterium]|nr:hypothetical protein [Rhodospirillales bacterium]